MTEQWLVHDKKAVAATVRALEVFALGWVGHMLEQHPVIQMRALGNVMSKIAKARTRHMLGQLPHTPATDEATAAMRSMVQVAGWLTGQKEQPVAALDQLHAAVFYFDSRLNGAGVAGAGWLRELARGD